MNKNAPIILVIIPSLMALACFSRRDLPAPPSVIAFVNGSSIKEDQLRFALDLERSKYAPETLKDSSLALDIKKEILDKLITNRLIIDWGMKQGIMISEEELTEGMEELKKGYTQREFELMLEEKKIPMIRWRNMAEETVHVQKIIREALGKKVNINDQEISAYYRTHQKEFETKERVKVRHIVTDTEQKAVDLRQRVQKGENFAKAAIMHSISPDRSNGGELGYFSQGNYPEEFDICFKLSEGEISPVIKSPYGYHIFKLIDKKPRGFLNLEEVKGRIVDHLARKKLRNLFDPWLKEIKSAGQVQIINDRVKEIKL